MPLPPPTDTILAKTVLAQVLSVLGIEPMESPDEPEEVAHLRARAFATILIALDEGETRPDVLFSRTLSSVSARS
jgi:hypothetical protein